MAAVPIINEERGPDYTTGKYKQQDLGPSLQTRFRDYAEENPEIGLLGAALGPGKYWKGLKGAGKGLGWLMNLATAGLVGKEIYNQWPKSEEEKEARARRWDVGVWPDGNKKIEMIQAREDSIRNDFLDQIGYGK